MTKILVILLAAVAVTHAQDRTDLNGYTLVFSDEFDTISVGDHFNKGTDTWGDWPPYGSAGAFSRSHWVRSRLQTVGGILRLHMVWNPSRNDPLDNNWESGFIASMDRQRQGFAQKFGYWSARIKMPQAGQGAWGAFWLGSRSGIPNGGSKGYEIDIIEWYGTGTVDTPPDKYGWSIHAWNTDGSRGEGSGGSFVDIPGGDAVGAWHVYGCEVNEENIVMYLDGQEVGRVPTNHDYLQEPVYMMVNYALRNSHPGEPFASKGSSFMQVDWVRAYSLPTLMPPTNLRTQQ
jgi:beta-glucanase (GH16 family)